MEDITHIHEWFLSLKKINGEEEDVYWCRNCLATKDSDGGIID